MSDPIIDGRTAEGPKISIHNIAEVKGTLSVVQSAVLIPAAMNIKECDDVRDPTQIPRSAPMVITGMKSPPLPPVPEMREVAPMISMMIIKISYTGALAKAAKSGEPPLLTLKKRE